MNPSNFGNLNSGFSNSTQFSNQDPNFSSRSSLSSSAKGGLSRPRLVKVRRQSNPQNFNGNEDIWARSGFNPFRPDTSRVELGGSGSTGFDSGSGGGTNVNENDKSGHVFSSDGNKSFSVDESMQKLSIDDKEKVVDGESKLSANARFESGDNVGGSIGRNVGSVLSDELEKKLNFEEAGDATKGGGSFRAEDIKKFGLKSSEKCSDIFADASENALPDRIKKLSVKDFVDTYNVNNEKDSFAFGSREALAVMWVEKMRVYFHVRGVAS
ncbi:hypothetical protein NC653_022845 [Populus alba x Populus x berolinensis]|uniref:Uncharacterized protein n=1 Tax=Populus alba x Populus x berolinensis TaxID=444605 RepID=A0AAD6MFX3_9ROSI|nr:hypothetical protein NC653_022845 [Populus alba x Populus x berolinensis]